jgi:iron complex outermembrane receptor protein
MRNMRALLFASTVAAGGLAAAGAAAQTAPAGPPAARPSGSTLEEIVVTARKRQENLQTTPIAISAVSAQALEQHHVTTLAKIAEIAPNMNTFRTSGSLGTAASFIRGVGFGDLILDRQLCRWRLSRP